MGNGETVNIYYKYYICPDNHGVLNGGETERPFEIEVFKKLEELFNAETGYKAGLERVWSSAAKRHFYVLMKWEGGSLFIKESHLLFY